MHVHIGIAEAIKFWMYVVIFGFFWREAESHFVLSDSQFFQAIGKAMAFIY